MKGMRLHCFWSGYRLIWVHLQAALDALSDVGQFRGRYKVIALAFCGLLISWHIYVPIHELLHVAGCLIGGGQISELSLSPHYGGTVLDSIFPFIVADSEYAGRLSGFDTGGSDMCYLITVFMPYLLTIACGATLLRWSREKRNPLLFGAGMVLAVAPFISLTGDFLELGAIVVTRLLIEADVLLDMSFLIFANLDAYRSDDLFKLLGEMTSQPSMFGIRSPGDAAFAALIVLASQFVALILAGWTYALSAAWDTALVRLTHRATK